MDLKTVFKQNADRLTELGTEPRFVATAFAAGLALMPFSAKFGYMTMATPTIYTGLGATYRIAHKLMGKMSGPSHQ